MHRGSAAQELRSIARPLKRGDLLGAVWAAPAAIANLWNRYARPHAPARFLCPCCGHTTHAFVHLGDHEGLLWNYACQTCDSRSRHRGLALMIPRILAERPDLRRTLHFAPEEVLAKVLLLFEQIEHHTTDLGEPGCDFPGEDIQRLSFADGAYDLIVCNQVIEHVPDDHAAMSEMSRILPADGLAIITVPCDWQKDETEEFRRVRPGGHYRGYGRDLADRLAQFFEEVQFFDMHLLRAAPNGLGYGIREREMLFACSKRKPSGLRLEAWAEDLSSDHRRRVELPLRPQIPAPLRRVDGVARVAE